MRCLCPAIAAPGSIQLLCRRKAMKVTFDSNVWRIVSSPEKFPKEVAIEDFKAIRNAIESGKVSAFLCETVFTLEAIQRNKRREFLSGYKSKAQTSISESEGEIKMSLSIGPDKSAHPGNSGYLESHLKDALSVGLSLQRSSEKLR